MEIWFSLLVSLFALLALKILLNLFPSQTKKLSKLPPGPPLITILPHFIRFSAPQDVERLACRLKFKYGPIITLRLGSRIFIIVSDHTIAHQALIQNGAVFANRPPAFGIRSILNSKQHTINSSFYGPLWRILRRNMSEMMQPSRIKAFSDARKWAVKKLIQTLKNEAFESGNAISVMYPFQHAIFRFLMCMCFGEKLDDKAIDKQANVFWELVNNYSRFSSLDNWPKLFQKTIFRKKWNRFMVLHDTLRNLYLPLIRARQEKKNHCMEQEIPYVDTLVDLILPDEGGRRFTESEIVSLCFEFLNAGVDTTSTTLLWIMANLVKYPDIQEKLYKEMESVINGDELIEEDLQKMPYLEAVILEGLRRHPPGHFVLPHAVTEDTMLNGYFVPKNATLLFLAFEIGCDPNIWEDPKAFRPERFLSEEKVFDITGSKEIKMMPFGVGRRICPGMQLGLLNLQYFVANLVWELKWSARKGDDIDLSEDEGFTIVMKYPLQAHISPRIVR